MSKPCGGAATFQEMLEHVPRGIRFLVSIVCGNDYYSQKVKPVIGHMEQAIADYCSRASKLATVHLAVTGMPSDVWGYKSWMTSTSWQQYDSNSATFRALFEKHKAVAITGAAQLSRIQVADRVGHVHVDSERVVSAAYLSWSARPLQHCLPLRHRRLQLLLWSFHGLLTGALNDNATISFTVVCPVRYGSCPCASLTGSSSGTLKGSVSATNTRQRTRSRFPSRHRASILGMRVGTLTLSVGITNMRKRGTFRTSRRPGCLTAGNAIGVVLGDVGFTKPRSVDNAFGSWTCPFCSSSSSCLWQT